MTERERNVMMKLDGSIMEHLMADEIGEIMNIVTHEEEVDKNGNILFGAITKSFVLGYIRGSDKKRISQRK